MESRLKVTGYDEKDQTFAVVTSTGETVNTVDTFAEMFHHNATANSVLDNSLLFMVSKQS